MIPKVIHYCWFGGKELPKLAKKCIASWEKFCPDYEIVRWDESNFDLDMNGYTRMCVAEKNAQLEGYAQGLSFEETVPLAVAAVQRVVEEKMRLFGSAGKA